MQFDSSIGKVLQMVVGLKGDEHGVETPGRFLAMLDEVTECKNCDESCIKWKDFPAETQDMIVVQRIPFSSVCNHHLVTFAGFAHIAYVPSGRMAGLSKFARVVKHYARQVQVQERLTAQISGYLHRQLAPQGVAVVLRAEHLCMTIRGVQAPGTYTTTARMTGVFADHDRSAKLEFLTYLGGQH